MPNGLPSHHSGPWPKLKSVRHTIVIRVQATEDEIQPKRVVICGGGAIGVAIAYFISLRGARAIVIERYEVAGAASGKSGGFLAFDWCRGTPLDQLARRSFALHAQLSSDSAILGDIGG